MIRRADVQVNVAVLLGAPRERAKAELKAGKLSLRMRSHSSHGLSETG